MALKERAPLAVDLLIQKSLLHLSIWFPLIPTHSPLASIPHTSLSQDSALSKYVKQENTHFRKLLAIYRNQSPNDLKRDMK